MEIDYSFLIVPSVDIFNYLTVINLIPILFRMYLRVF